MPAIYSVSSLRSYTEVYDRVRPGSSAFRTKDGHTEYAILKIGDYDRLIAEGKLFAELNAGRVSGEQNGWISAKNVSEYFAKKASNIH